MKDNNDTLPLEKFVQDMESRPVLRELEEAGYSHVANEGKYWLMRHTDDKPVIYYDHATDSAVPFTISNQFETYMRN